MKKKNLHRIFILMIILFYPVVMVASLKPDYNAVKVEHIVTFSPDYELSQNLGTTDLTSRNSEEQIIILRDAISVPLKTVTSSSFILLYLLSKNISNDISVPITRELISNFHCSTLFTGVLLI